MTTTPTTDPAELLSEVLAADDDDVEALLRQLWHNTPEDHDGQRAWLLALDDAIRVASEATMGELAILAGALIENGGPHDAFPPAIFERLGALLERLGEYGIRTLTSAPPTLDELFLEQYRTPEVAGPR